MFSGEVEQGVKICCDLSCLHAHSQPFTPLALVSDDHLEPVVLRRCVCVCVGATKRIFFSQQREIRLE